MSDRIRSSLTFVIAIGIVIAVASATTLAQGDEPAAIEPAAGLNADTVDGRHAVGSGASKAKRARKLVATNSSGFLPSNIVKPKWGFIKNKPGILADGKIGWGEVFNKPGILADNKIGWGEVVNKPAGFADGVDNGGYITDTNSCGGDIPAAPNGRYVIYEYMPRHMVHEFQVVPTGSASSWLYIDRVETRTNPDGTLRLWVYVKQISNIPGATCNMRHIAWFDGISVAAAKASLADVKVGSRTKHGK